MKNGKHKGRSHGEGYGGGGRGSGGGGRGKQQQQQQQQQQGQQVQQKQQVTRSGVDYSYDRSAVVREPRQRVGSKGNGGAQQQQQQQQAPPQPHAGGKGGGAPTAVIQPVAQAKPQQQAAAPPAPAPAAVQAPPHPAAQQQQQQQQAPVAVRAKPQAPVAVPPPARQVQPSPPPPQAPPQDQYRRVTHELPLNTDVIQWLSNRVPQRVKKGGAAGTAPPPMDLQQQQQQQQMLLLRQQQLMQQGGGPLQAQAQQQTPQRMPELVHHHHHHQALHQEKRHEVSGSPPPLVDASMAFGQQPQQQTPLQLQQLHRASPPSPPQGGGGESPTHGVDEVRNLLAQLKDDRSLLEADMRQQQQQQQQQQMWMLMQRRAAAQAHMMQQQQLAAQQQPPTPPQQDQDQQHHHHQLLQTQQLLQQQQHLAAQQQLQQQAAAAQQQVQNSPLVPHLSHQPPPLDTATSPPPQQQQQPQHVQLALQALMQQQQLQQPRQPASSASGRGTPLTPQTHSPVTPGTPQSHQQQPKAQMAAVPSPVEQLSQLVTAQGGSVNVVQEERRGTRAERRERERENRRNDRDRDREGRRGDRDQGGKAKRDGKGKQKKRQRNDRATAQQARRQREAEQYARWQQMMEDLPSNPYTFMTQRNHSEFMAELKKEHERRMATKGNIHEKLMKEIGTLSGERPDSIVERLDVQKILKLVDENQVTFVVTETGSGKSTNVPKGLMDALDDVLIGTTQPRRTATINLATRVSDLLGDTVGGPVGYWIRGERKGDENTKLWYMTSYTLLLRLLSSPMKPPFTHIIIDEFHERQPDIEVTVALLRMCLLRGGDFKLILMSATLNTEDWVSYFDGLSVGVYTDSVTDYPIHNYFLEDCSTLCGMAVMPSKTFQPGAVSPLVVDNAVLVAQEVIKLVCGISHPSQAILVFLPGRVYVERFKTWVGQKMGNRLHPVAWHSMIELAVIQDAILKAAPDGKQKIYLATDIAEVSITLPDAVYVIDLCLVKRPHINPNITPSILFPPLVLQWISHGSHQQRRGRVGRTQPGFYFSMLSEDHVECLTKYPVPPICHSRLDDLTLHLLQICKSPLCMYSLCRREPITRAVTAALSVLVENGCAVEDVNADLVDDREADTEAFGWSDHIMTAKAELTEEENKSYYITFKGRLIQRMPVASRAGNCAYYGALFEEPVTELMVVATAVIQSPCVFIVQAKQSDEEKARGLPPNPKEMGEALEQCEGVMKAHKLEMSSDMIACMSIYLHWRKFLETCQGPAEEHEWCERNCVSLERLVNLHDFCRHIRAEIALFLPYMPEREPPPGEMHELLEVHKKTVCLLGSVAACDAGIRVTKEGSVAHKQREGGIAYFLGTKAVPDMHQASVVRWHTGTVAVCSSITLRPGSASVVAGFITDVFPNESRYFLVCALFAHALRFKRLVDDVGAYVQMAVTWNNLTKYLEVDEQGHEQIVSFRAKLSKVMMLTRLRQEHGDMNEEEFEDMLAKDGHQSLRMARAEVTALMHYDLLAEDSALQLEEVESAGFEDEPEEICVDYLRFSEPPVKEKVVVPATPTDAAGHPDAPAAVAAGAAAAATATAPPAGKRGKQEKVHKLHSGGGSRGAKLLQEVPDAPAVNHDREAELTRRQSESLRKQEEAFASLSMGGNVPPPFGSDGAPQFGMAAGAAAPLFGQGFGGVTSAPPTTDATPPPFGAFSALVEAEAKVEAIKDAEDQPPQLARSISDDGEDPAALMRDVAAAMAQDDCAASDSLDFNPPELEDGDDEEA